MLNARDRAGLEPLFHPDFTAWLPQSGEMSRGFEGFWAQFESYPGVFDSNDDVLPDPRLIGDHDRWVITPGFNVVPLTAPNSVTMLYRDVYPDGSTWYVVGLLELRDELIYRFEFFFAPELPAPLAESIAAYQHG
jgi:hypothetical protein